MSRARTLRRNSTKAEQKMWALLRNRSLASAKFRRQQPIGPYIVDFISFECRLIIEIDGGQHADRATEDETRTRWLESQGFQVLRFWNNEALGNPDGVLVKVAEALRTPHPAAKAATLSRPGSARGFAPCTRNGGRG
jgi:very-short-patch-repair endonuclease